MAGEVAAAPIWLTYLTGFVSLAAFLRPDAERWVRRMRAKCVFEALPNVDVSATNFGPQIGIVGTFVARNGDLIIKNAYLKVIRKQDNATHLMQWVFFRPMSLVIDPQKIVESTTVCGPIVLKEGKTERVNILFCDLDTKKRWEEINSECAKQWRAYTESLTSKQGASMPLSPQDTLKEFIAWTNANNAPAKALAHMKSAFYGQVEGFESIVYLKSIIQGGWTSSFHLNLALQKTTLKAYRKI